MYCIWSKITPVFQGQSMLHTKNWLSLFLNGWGTLHLYCTSDDSCTSRSVHLSNNQHTRAHFQVHLKWGRNGLLKSGPFVSWLLSIILLHTESADPAPGLRALSLFSPQSTAVSMWQCTCELANYLNVSTTSALYKTVCAPFAYFQGCNTFHRSWGWLNLSKKSFVRRLLSGRGSIMRFVFRFYDWQKKARGLIYTSS